MPIRYEIYPPEKLVLVTASETLTVGDLLGYLDLLSRDIDYVPPMKKLFDGRAVTRGQISQEDSERIAEKRIALKDVFREERCAIVARTDLGFGIGRVLEAHMLGAGIDTMVFRKIEKAVAWLGIVDFDTDRSR